MNRRRRLEALATDVDRAILRRACESTYQPSSLRELTGPWRDRGFLCSGGRYALRPEHRRLVTVRRHDLRARAPAGPSDVLLCRNAAFTYFAPERQRGVLRELTGALRTGGALVIGVHEQPVEHLQKPDMAIDHRRACISRVRGPP